MKPAFFLLIILTLQLLAFAPGQNLSSTTPPQGTSDKSPNSTEMTTPNPMPSLVQMIQSLQKRLDLFNSTLTSLKSSSSSSLNISQQVASNSRRIGSNSTGKWTSFTSQLVNLSSRIEQLEESGSSGASTSLESRLSSLEDNLGKISVQMATLGGNSSSRPSPPGTSGTWVHNYSVWVTNSTSPPTNWSPSTCNCNCGRRNKFIFG